MLAQAISGYMSITGLPGGPADAIGQSISTTTRACCAPSASCPPCHYRHRTGTGQRDRPGLLDSLLCRARQPRRALHRRRRGAHAGRQSSVRRLELRALSRRRTGTSAIAAGRATRCGRRFCEIIGARASSRARPGFATSSGVAETAEDSVAGHLSDRSGRASDPRAGRRSAFCRSAAACPRRGQQRRSRVVEEPQVGTSPRDGSWSVEPPEVRRVEGQTGTPLKSHARTPGQIRWLRPHARRTQRRDSSTSGLPRPLPRKNSPAGGLKASSSSLSPGGAAGRPAWARTSAAALYGNGSLRPRPAPAGRPARPVLPRARWVFAPPPSFGSQKPDVGSPGGLSGPPRSAGASA
jgi:hypothetical protein